MQDDKKKKPSLMDGSLKPQTAAVGATGIETVKKTSLITAYGVPQKISPLKFPQRNEAEKPLGTNIENMLKCYRMKVVYDVIKKDFVISIPGLISGKDNYRNVAEDLGIKGEVL